MLAFRADPEVQAALEAAELPELLVADPRDEGETWEQLLEWPLPDVDALANRRRRHSSTSTSWPSSTSTAFVELRWSSLSRPLVSEDTAAVRRQNTARCCGACEPTAQVRGRSWPSGRGWRRPRSARSSADLVELGAVVEEGTQAEGRGRPGRPVRLAGGAFVGLGFELNVDYVAAVALDLAGDVALAEVRPLVCSVLPALSLLDLAREVSSQLRRVDPGGRDIRGPRTGRARTTAPCHGPPTSASRARPSPTTWSWPWGVASDGPTSTTTPTARRWPRRTAAPRWTRHTRLYLTGTVGIGAGIVQDGELVRGASGFAGEVGHMPIGDPEAQVRLWPARLLGGLDRPACDVGGDGDAGAGEPDPVRPRRWPAARLSILRLLPPSRQLGSGSASASRCWPTSWTPR